MFPLSYRFLEYKAAQDQTDVAQPSVSACFSNVLVYISKSPRQQAINASIIKDLVIGCGLPLALVENCYFRKFLKVMDSKYTPISKSTISEKRIPVLVNQVKQTIVERLQRQPSVSVTVDIWSNRRLRSFLGVTVHAVHCPNGSCVLEPYLLECRWFTGRHSGERISAAFEEILEEYGITQKVCYIITDNSANALSKCKCPCSKPLTQKARMILMMRSYGRTLMRTQNLGYRGRGFLVLPILFS